MIHNDDFDFACFCIKKMLFFNLQKYTSHFFLKFDFFFFFHFKEEEELCFLPLLLFLWLKVVLSIL